MCVELDKIHFLSTKTHVVEQYFCITQHSSHFQWFSVHSKTTHNIRNSHWTGCFLYNETSCWQSYSFFLYFLLLCLVFAETSMDHNTITSCHLSLSLLSPFCRLMLTARWPTWCPFWAAWSIASTTHCCLRSELWPTVTRLYWGAAVKTSTGWATRSLL